MASLWPRDVPIAGWRLTVSVLALSGANAPAPGCGTQHPLRALGGTRVLLAAAPTTPPCVGRRPRSSSLLPRGELIAAYGQLLLSTGDALAPPLGELLNEVKLRWLPLFYHFLKKISKFS